MSLCKCLVMFVSVCRKTCLGPAACCGVVAGGLRGLHPGRLVEPRRGASAAGASLPGTGSRSRRSTKSSLTYDLK